LPAHSLSVLTPTLSVCVCVVAPTVGMQRVD